MSSLLYTARWGGALATGARGGGGACSILGGGEGARKAASGAAVAAKPLGIDCSGGGGALSGSSEEWRSLSLPRATGRWFTDRRLTEDDLLALSLSPPCCACLPWRTFWKRGGTPLALADPGGFSRPAMAGSADAGRGGGAVEGSGP